MKAIWQRWHKDNHVEPSDRTVLCFLPKDGEALGYGALAGARVGLQTSELAHYLTLPEASSSLMHGRRVKEGCAISEPLSLGGVTEAKQNVGTSGHRTCRAHAFNRPINI